MSSFTSKSGIIPKESLTAYQRWELASFGDERPSTLQKQAEDDAKTAEQLAVEEAARQTAEHQRALEAERLAAYNAGLEEGRAAGFEQGKSAGFEQGHTDGLTQGRAEAAEERARLQQIAQTFGDEVAQAGERMAVDMLDLTLDLSKAMLKTALNLRPELVIPVVAEAIRYLPMAQQPALLTLHPDDALLVNSQLSNELSKGGWRVVEDAQMERGGCRVETGSNQIDATAPSRWQRIAAALGKESDWLAP
jgi:flagellar assembly protein FliH